jgi:hypothetical protein
MSVTPSLGVFHIDRMRRSNWSDVLHRVRFLTAVHMSSCIQRRPRDPNSHLHANDQEIDRTCFTVWPDALHTTTGRVSVSIWSLSREVPKSDFVNQTHLISCDRMRHRVRSALRHALFPRCMTGRSSFARDRTRRSCRDRIWSSVRSHQWHPFASVSSLNPAS